MQALQNKPLRRRNLDIHYSIPKDNPSDKDINQGSIVIYNLDSTVSNDELHHIFGVYGEIKEILEGSRHKSIEFCDIRSAEAALRELNKSEMGGGGKQVKLDADETSALLQMCSPPPPTDFIRGKSGTVSNVIEHSTSLLWGGVSGSSQLLDTNSFSSMIGVESGGSLQNQLKYDFRNTPPPPNYHPHSLPDGLTNSILANSLNTRISERLVGNRQQFNRIGGRALELNNNNDNVFGNAIGGSPASHHYTWNPSHHNMMWPNSPSLMNGLGNAHSLPRRQSAHNMMTANTAYMHINNHNHHHHHVVGSAPSVNSSIWDCRRQQHSSSSYAAGESPDTTLFHPGSLGNMRNSPHHHHPIMDFVSHNNIFHPPPPRLGGGGDLPIPSKNISHHQNSIMFPSRGGQQMIPMMTSSSSSSFS